MELVKFHPRPGVFRDITDYANSGGWYDCDKVRFRNGFPESIGGWQKVLSTQMSGVCRSMAGWTSLSGTIYIGLGTHLKYYAYQGGSLQDITPVRRSVTLGASPIATTSGSTTVTITDTAHGASAGDYVTLGGITTFNGLNVAELNTELVIVSVPGPNTYTVTVTTAATATGSGGGSVVTAEYQVSPGLADTTTGSGWGAGTWGRDTWGQPSTSGTAIGSTMRLWTQDNFGENLVLCVRGGPIAYWQLASTTRATLLTNLSGANNVPAAAYEIVVSANDRHVIAFGTTDIGSTTIDPLLIRWGDTESVTNWLPTSTNTAGDLRVGMGSKIITARQTRQEILVWTDVSLHSLQFVGAPYTFGLQTLATNVDIIGPKAKIAVNDMVFWMGTRSFYVYDGRVQPLPCPVLDYVFGNLNYVQGDKVYACLNSAYNEVTWFFPWTGGNENDSYVTYNYQDKVWTFGFMARTAWLDRGLLSYPIAASPDGYLYYHEIGTDDGSTNPPSALNPYIESSPMEIGDGEHFAFVSRMLPDLTFKGSATTPQATFTLTPRDYPGGALGSTTGGTVTRSTTVPGEQFTQQIDVRLRGRSIALRCESNAAGVGWRLGIPRFEVRSDGRR